jgi:hypothetical protein
MEKSKCKWQRNIYRIKEGEGRSLKRLIVFGIMLMLLAVYASTIMAANSATGASIVMSPDTATSPNSTFMLNLTINNVNDMRAWNLALVYQKIISLNLVDTINNTVFTDGSGLVIYKQEDFNSTYYYCTVARTTIDVVPGMGTGSGVVAQLNFFAVSNGKTTISAIDSETELLNSQVQLITPVTFTGPTITVATPQPTPPPKPSAVGGTSFSLATAASSTAYIGLASITIIAVVAIIATTIYFKGIKRRKEKQ